MEDGESEEALYFAHVASRCQWAMDETLYDILGQTDVEHPFEGG